MQQQHLIIEIQLNNMAVYDLIALSSILNQSIICQMYGVQNLETEVI